MPREFSAFDKTKSFAHPVLTQSAAIVPAHRESGRESRQPAAYVLRQFPFVSL
jgi:hypothetical protein